MRAETASIPANTAQSIASNDLRVETSSPLSSMVVGKFFSVFFLSFFQPDLLSSRKAKLHARESESVPRFVLEIRFVSNVGEPTRSATVKRTSSDRQIE